MNEEAEQALAQIIERAVDGIDGAVIFTQEHLPDVVQQLLMWNFYSSTFWGLLFLVALIFVLRYAVVFGKKEMALTGDPVASLAVGSALSLFLFIASATRISTAAKILIAPKLYLLEYAAGLL